jgi:hypothetical protein
MRKHHVEVFVRQAFGCTILVAARYLARYDLGRLSWMCTINGVWLILDTRPPVWDMALHQAFALHYLPGFPAPEGLRIWQWSGNYPPLVHIFIATAFWIFHPNPDIAALANIPATFLLLWSIFELGTYLGTAAGARWACILMLFTPYLMWMSRETILDYWLSAWVACAMAVLVKTDGFRSPGASRTFGLICAAGLLTKWLFAGFIAAPFALIAVRHGIWRDRRRLWNAAQALILAMVIAGAWYAPNIPRLIRYFSENAQIGVLEGEPPVLSFQSSIYYLRLLEGYQLYGLLFVLLAAGIVFVFSRHLFKDPFFWMVCIGSGWLAMTLLRTKDPRFTMPLLGPLLLAPGAWLAECGRVLAGRVARLAVVGVLVFQAYAVNFGIAWLPQEVVFMRGYQGSLRWDWQLFSHNYFGILGAPRREDWKQEEIIDRIVKESRLRGSGMSLALVPDLPRFNTSNFLLAAAEAKLPLRFDHLTSVAAGLATFQYFDFVILSDVEQGMSWTTHGAMSLNQFILSRPETFKPVENFTLPNNDMAHLFFINHAAAAR